MSCIRLLSQFGFGLLNLCFSAFVLRILEMDDGFLNDDAEHQHDERVSSCGFHIKGEVNQQKLNEWLGWILKAKGADLFRTKGVLAVQGMKEKFVFQVGSLRCGHHVLDMLTMPRYCFKAFFISPNKSFLLHAFAEYEPFLHRKFEQLAGKEPLRYGILGALYWSFSTEITRQKSCSPGFLRGWKGFNLTNDLKNGWLNHELDRN